MMINKTIGTERPFGEGSLPHAANKHDLALNYMYCMLKTSSHSVWVLSVMVVTHDDCEFLNIIVAGVSSSNEHPSLTVDGWSRGEGKWLE